MIETHALCKSYGDRMVVDNVTLQLPASGIVAIIGPNGAGKSTLLAMISRLMPASAGQVLVDGRDVFATPGEELARTLSVLRQDNHISARLSVRELVAFGRYPHCKGRPGREDWRQVDQALEYLKLTELKDSYLDQISGGQRQRAFIAMVLCQDTRYILLDEPLNNLDMAAAVGMMTQLRHAADELGKTVVMVIHDINFASCYSDWVVAMKDGAVVAQGSPAQVMDAGLLQTIFGLKVSVHQHGTARIATYYREGL